MIFRIAACCVVGVLTLGLGACSEEAPAPAPEAPDTSSAGADVPSSQTVQEEAAAAAEQIGGKIDQAAEGVQDDAEEAGEQVQEGVDAAEEAVNDAMDKASENAEDAAAGVSSETDTVLEETGNQAAEGGGQAGAVRDGAVRALEDAGVNLGK